MNYIYLVPLLGKCMAQVCISRNIVHIKENLMALKSYSYYSTKEERNIQFTVAVLF